MASKRFKLNMHQKVWRYRIEKWFWMVITLAVVVADLYFNKQWQAISIIYLAIVSNYALVLTAGGAEQAAEAAFQASDEELPE